MTCPNSNVTWPVVSIPIETTSSSRVKKTWDIKKLETEFDPHVGIDCHEYVASRGYGPDNEYLPAQNGQFSAMKNLNINFDIRNLSETVFTYNIAAAIDKHELRHRPYIITPIPVKLTLHEIPTDTKTDVHAALMQGVQMLTGSRGISLGDQHFHRRTTAGLMMIEAVMQTVIDNAEHIKRTVETAREDYINGGYDIVVTDYPRPSNITWPSLWLSAATSSKLPFSLETTHLPTRTWPVPDLRATSSAKHGQMSLTSFEVSVSKSTH